YASAQFNLGVMYANGKGVPKDASQAVTWYRKAVEQGHASAHFNLGVMYANGEGVPKDYVQAAKWFYLGKANGVEADKAIRQIESRMSHQQIEQAQALATQWWQNHH
ncbi:tetratricopeptide repeat protein, partial [Thalassolituus marinus]